MSPGLPVVSRLRRRAPAAFSTWAFVLLAGCPSAAPRPVVASAPPPPSECDDPFDPACGLSPPPVPADADGDTLSDAEDRCPTEAEDFDGFHDHDGCPDPDNDEDGFLDEVDACPTAAETVNDFEDDDGCPDQRPVPQRLVLEETVQFEFDTAIIRGVSYPVLDDVARMLREHPEYRRVNLVGHADYQGDVEANLRLSQRRAERVRDALIRKGIEPGRLTVSAAGEADPLVDGQRLIDNRLNRRVEFVIEEIAP
ncbi:MAG: OmpA family protein [Deltaproteobacteria bacterium]|nr:OmpA family protein [Deltaproteobacteria bacterium]